jgi:thiosulfate/3-mercaptopyruvate sulfurtransferase
VVGAAVFLASTATAVAVPKYKGFAKGEALITVEELSELLDAKDPKLIVLAVVEPASYKTGHIPTSRNVWRPDYEHKLWWAFYLYGKTDVRVLDGGYPAWKAVFPGTDAPPAGARGEKAGNFVARQRRSGWLASMDDVRRAQVRKRVHVWDAREPAEWSGAEKKGSARRAGRVPWAAFQSWKEYRLEIDGKPTAFKSAAEIREVIDRFKMDPRDENIFYCQSGVRSTTAVFALWLMGWEPDRLYNYEGSWLEWSYYDSNPVPTDQ